MFAPWVDGRLGTVHPVAPSLTDITRTSLSTLRAFGQRIPGAGGLVAHSLADAVSGRNVMITGASSGIGKSAAMRVGAAGGTALLVARSEDALNETRHEIERRGGTAFVHRCDLSDPDDIDRMAAEALEQHS